MRIQIATRHCEVPQDVRDRAHEQIAALSKFDPRASSAEVVFEEEKVTRKVEVIVHSDGSAPLVATGSAGDFRGALDQVVDRMARILRDHRKRQREHQAPPTAERLPGG